MVCVVDSVVDHQQVFPAVVELELPGSLSFYPCHNVLSSHTM